MAGAAGAVESSSLKDCVGVELRKETLFGVGRSVSEDGQMVESDRQRTSSFVRQQVSEQQRLGLSGR